MKTTDPGDAARIELLLAELRLPAVKLVWASLATQADKEGWPAARFPAALAEHEIAERARRRLERHLAEARLPPGKTLDTFDFEAVPVVGPSYGARRRRRLVKPRRQFAVVWAARRGQEPSGGCSRLRPCRKRLARALHPHNRSRPASANRPPRTRARSRHCQARQIPPPDPR